MGFSSVNIKRMRQFYEEWGKAFQTIESQSPSVCPLVADEIQTDLLLLNRPLVTDDLAYLNLEYFLAIGFTHHYEILIKTKTIEERLFYINKYLCK